MRSIFPNVARRPFWALLGVLVVTGLALAGLIDPRTGEPRLRVDPSLAQLRSAGDESHEFYEHARKLFGDDETLLLALLTDAELSLKKMSARTDTMPLLTSSFRTRNSSPGHRLPWHRPATICSYSRTACSKA